VKNRKSRAIQTVSWGVAQLLLVLIGNSWSSVRHFIRQSVLNYFVVVHQVSPQHRAVNLRELAILKSVQ